MIELEEIIKEQNPALLEQLRGYKMTFLKWLLKLKSVNAILEKYKDKQGIDFVEAMLDHFELHIKVEGFENLDPTKRYIFASNHPSAGIDGLAFIYAVHQFTPELQVIVKDVLCHLKPLRPVFTPVNTYHRQKSDFVTKLDSLYRSNKQVLILPSGACSRKHNGIIKDLDWESHFIKKSITYKRDVVPVHISGKNPEYFYFAAQMREKLGVKYGAEELLLSRAFLGQKSETLTVTFKKPVAYTVFDKSKRIKDWAQYVKELVYKTN